MPKPRRHTCLGFLREGVSSAAAADKRLSECLGLAPRLGGGGASSPYSLPLLWSDDPLSQYEGELMLLPSAELVLLS